jgi:hypothetical protein
MGSKILLRKGFELIWVEKGGMERRKWVGLE